MPFSIWCGPLPALTSASYRQTTVRRRLLRRLALLRLGSLRDYVEHVKENPGELHSLTQDVLIRVTHFFRDPEAFEVLGRRVFPALIRQDTCWIVP